jgi:hypothetical protein
MDDQEIERLRKAIRHSFASQPHKIKYWLALLDMYAKRLEDAGDSAAGTERVDISRVAVNPSLGAGGKTSLFSTPRPTPTRSDPVSERARRSRIADDMRGAGREERKR